MLWDLDYWAYKKLRPKHQKGKSHHPPLLSRLFPLSGPNAPHARTPCRSTCPYDMPSREGCHMSHITLQIQSKMRGLCPVAHLANHCGLLYPPSVNRSSYGCLSFLLFKPSKPSSLCCLIYLSFLLYGVLLGCCTAIVFTPLSLSYLLLYCPKHSDHWLFFLFW